MISPNDYIDQRNPYHYRGGNMMAPEKDVGWSQALQSMATNEHQRQQLAQQSMLGVGSNQGIGYQSSNNNAYISFQQMPQGITVYQPVVNTGIVVDFRQNNNNTPMPNSFSPGSQVPSVNTNRFDPSVGRVTDLSNAYNQVLQGQMNANGYVNYTEPPPYSNYFHNVTAINGQSMNSLDQTAQIMNKTSCVGNMPAVANRNITVIDNSHFVDEQMSAAINGQFMNGRQNSLQVQSIPVNNKPLQANQPSVISNTRIVNIQTSSFPNNSLTITKTVESPSSSVIQSSNMVYRKEGALVVPTLSQLLDRSVVQPNYQSTLKDLNAMFKTQPETNSNAKQMSIPVSTENVVVSTVVLDPQKPGETKNVASEPLTNDPPRKARFKISPRLSKEAKKNMWLSHFTQEPKMNAIDEDTEDEELPVASTSNLPQPDENNQWNMSQFRDCYVKVTKLPREIEEIYFAKGNYKQCHEPLVYVVPNIDKKKIVRFKNIGTEEPKSTCDRIPQIEPSKTTLDAPKADIGEITEGSLKTILKIKKLKRSEGYEIMEKKDDKDLKTTIKKCKIKRSNKRSERSRCNFCGKMRKPADNWRHVMAIYSKNLDEKDQISKDQVKDVCQKCDTTVCSKVALTLHQQHVHGNEIEETSGSFECFVCKKFLKTKDFLAFHLQTHYYSPKKTRKAKRASENADVDLSNTCEICNRKFQTGCALTAHKKVHGIYPTNKCSICSKVFLKASHLKAHFVVHTDERPFSCNECDKTFRFRSSLKQHSHYHSDSLPYKCKICGKSFVANWSLSHHTKKVHKTKKEPCLICKQSFSDRLALGSHMKLYHGKTSPTKKNDNSKNEDKDSIAIEQLAESLLKQLAREEMDEGFDALTETEDVLNEETNKPKGNDTYESHDEENECELCDAILTSIPELEKHLLYYHRVKDNKMSKLLP